VLAWTWTLAREPYTSAVGVVFVLLLVFAAVYRAP
jgi:hypothetical protein